MYYLLAGMIGFLLSGVWFGAQLWLRQTFYKAGRTGLVFLAPLLASCIPTALLFAWRGPFSLHLSALSNGRWWLITAAALLCVCLIKLLTARKPSPAKGLSLLPLCAEAAFMEIAQRLMMQTFVLYLLEAWGCRTLWCVLINALIWCAGILVQPVLLKQKIDRNLLVDVAASFVFSIGGGYVFYQSGCIIFSMAAHIAERFFAVKVDR